MELEEIGSFVLDSSFVLPPDAEKSAFFPLEGIRFTYGRHAETTPELIDFLVAETGKIRSLIRADFESYLSEIRQFVNIGKPWVIEGIGTLNKTMEGEYGLIPGQLASERISTGYSAADDDYDGETSKIRKRRSFVTILFMLAVLAVVGGLGFGIYTLFIKPPAAIKTQEASVQPDITEPVFSDTTATKDSAFLSDSVAMATDTIRYKAIFEISKWRTKALTRLDYWNHAGIPTNIDSIIINDTLRYRLFIFKRSLPADTLKMKESLLKIFKTRIRLEASGR